MNKRRISVQFLLYFLMLMFLMITVGCSKKDDTPSTHTYTVTFDSQGATVAASPASEKVKSSTTTVDALPTPPTKTGYIFAGWFTAVDGGGTEFTASTKVKANITVYAKWNSYTYTVTFDNQGATVAASPASKTVVSPATTIDALPTEPTKSGYTFGGWWTGAAGGGTEFTASTIITANITVYAYWSINPVYTVTYNSQGGTAVGAQHVTSPATTVGALPTAPTKSGYAFGGWWWTPAGTSTIIEFTASTIVTADIKVSAKWNSYTYTVTFDSQGATIAASPASKTVVSTATTVDALPTAPIRIGYKFAGWWTGVNGTGTEFIASTTVTANITVYAYWSIQPVYTVKYDSQEGTAVGAQYVTYPATTVGALPTAPTRSGYAFGGWWTGAAGTGTAFKASTTVTANITVYAKWNSYTYTVTFNSQGATVAASPASKTVVSPITTVGALPTEPTRSGFTFAGWWIGAGGTGTEFIAGTTVTANITVYAYWTTNPVYTITYDSDGGTDVGTQHVTLPETTADTLPEAPTKSGYIFGGWFTAVHGGGIQFTDITEVTADITVYAKWNSYTYTVTFDSQGATVAASPASKTVVSPATTVGALPTEPTKSGYTFGGWWTGTNGTGEQFTATSPVTADIIVYANW
jgi:uncharacterized repeat protein (TIGR02543 family)